MKYPKVKLNQIGLKKYFSNHLWFRPQEIHQFEKIKNYISSGSLVNIFSENGFFLGCGYFNPKSYYSLKILTKEKTLINKDFFLNKFSKALELRKKIYPIEKCFRLIFSEGDFLPGLIVDIYDKVIVIQIQTLGMEKVKSFIIEALKDLFNPSAIILKNDSLIRQEEELELYVEIAYGKTEEIILVEMDEIKFLIPIIKGQKTGFFLDQRENRKVIKNLIKPDVILDVFSYTGGFSFYALKSGAKEAYLLERSEFALDLAKEIAKLNGWKDRIIPILGDAFQILKNPPKADLIVLDPPAFIKSQKDFKEGIKKYQTLYFLGTKAIKEGFLLAFSCSYFLKIETLKKFIQSSLKKLNKEGKIIFYGYQAPDHPVNPFIEETLYLKGIGIYIK